MLSATTILDQPDLPHATGHVRAALVRAGVEDVNIVKTHKGLRARGVRGRITLATVAAYTPLVFLGVFSRSAVEVTCNRSLNEGDDSLHLTTKVRALREFEDESEVDWVTRGPFELLGDLLQTRRVLNRIMHSLTQPTGAEPEGLGAAEQSDEDRAARRARFQERYRRGKARRRKQLIGLVVITVAYVGIRVWLDRTP
ncbi:MAG: hypothetical protein P1V81_06165 [Planctomycetota bacterium]|nr:hypothetical protein [Planctomycetota bacterium]